MTQQPKKSRRGLGRGLGALIQDTSSPESEQEKQAQYTTEGDETRTTQHQVKESSTPEKGEQRELVSSRYLEEPTTQRDKRRPSDLFFGGDSEPITGRTKKTSRVSMPNPILSRSTAPKAKVEEEETPVEGSLLRVLSLNDISPNPRQPREEFDEEDMIELVASITEVGVLQPVVVRSVGHGQYELIMGERRWRASRRAGLDTIPAIVRETADEDLLREALLENIHRSELNALEEAAAYQQLMKDFGWSQDVLAKRVGRSRPHISNTLRLMNLPPTIQRQVASSVLSAGHARAILGLGEESLMSQLAQKVINEGLSVRATEELASLMLRNGEETSKATPPPQRNTRQFDDMATSLTDLLDTQVKITLGAKKGRIAIDFGSVDDLNRIMQVISPDAEA